MRETLCSIVLGGALLSGALNGQSIAAGDPGGRESAALPDISGPDVPTVPFPPDLRILIVYADTDGAPGQLRAAVLTEPGVATVDLFDASAGTPTLAVMQAYDVVVPMSNSPFLDATALGDRLADYVDGGGKVVQLGFTFYGPAQPYGVNGRWVSGGYSPYVYSTDLSFAAFTLGTYSASNPLLAGVTTLASDYQNVVTLAAGAVAIATASNANPLVALRDLPANQTAGVTAYLGADATWSGEFSRIIVNAGRLVFVDRFESGGTSRWTTHFP